MRRVALAAALLVTAVILAPRTLASAAPDVTFTKDVAPILHAKCVTCHRAGEVAPMALLTFADTRPWRDRSKRRSRRGRCRPGSPTRTSARSPTIRA
jgi:hypothetical protein